jgi:hypothetical protein
MGNKSSSDKDSWHDVKLSAEPVPDTKVCALAPPTAAYKEHNLCGLDSNVFLLLFSYLSIADVTRAAQTCKSWRLLLLSDTIWVKFASEMGKYQTGNDRQFVVKNYSSYIPPDFVYLPKRYSGPEQSISDTVYVTLLSSADSGPGKSTLLVRLLESKWVEEYDPTIGKIHLRLFEIFLICFSEEYYDHTISYGARNNSVNLSILDTCGQEEYRAFYDGWFRAQKGHCVFMIVSRFDQDNVYDSIEMFARFISRSRDGDPFSIILVRTMSDKNKPMQQKGRILKWCAINHVPFVSTSAKTGVNAELAFQICCKMHQMRKK